MKDKDVIKRIFEMIIGIDMINARARYSMWLKGTKPEYIDENNQYKILIPNVTHPVLLEAVLDELPMEPLVINKYFIFKNK